MPLDSGDLASPLTWYHRGMHPVPQTFPPFVKSDGTVVPQTGGLNGQALGASLSTGTWFADLGPGVELGSRIGPHFAWDAAVAGAVAFEGTCFPDASINAVAGASPWVPESAASPIAIAGSAKASLALDPVTGDIDTVIEATTEGAGGNAITIAFVADGAGAGSFTRSGTALTFHYDDGVTTVTDFEAAIAALTGDDDIIGVKTAGTGAHTFDDPADTLAATALAGGVNGQDKQHWDNVTSHRVRAIVTITTAGVVRLSVAAKVG